MDLHNALEVTDCDPSWPAQCRFWKMCDTEKKGLKKKSNKFFFDE